MPKKAKVLDAQAYARWSFLLILPLIILFPVMSFQLEPFASAINSVVLYPDGATTTIFGKMLMLLLFAILPPVSAVVSTIPVVQSLRAKKGLFAHPNNLALAAITWTFVFLLVAGIIIDQYPCWMGVPNCD